MLVEHEGQAAAHAGGEVAPGRAQDDDAPAGHVLAAVVADALDDRVRAGVAHGEALAGQPAEEGAPARGAVEHGVADDDVLLGGEGDAVGRHHRERPAGQALARVVVGVAVQGEAHARRQPAAEGLAGRAGQVDLDGVGRQALGAVRLGDARAEHAAHAAVDVAHGGVDLHRLLGLDREARLAQQLPVEVVLEHRRRQLDAPAHGALGQLGEVQDVGEVDPARLPVVDGAVDLEQVGAADELLERAHAQRGHDPPQLLGHEEEEVHDVLGGALEALAQLRVLGGDADRARVQVAGAHHDAARRDQRRRREAELVGAQARGDGDVAPGLQLAVGLDGDARAQVVLAAASAGSRPGRSPTARRPTGSSSAARRRCRRRGRR